MKQTLNRRVHFFVAWSSLLLLQCWTKNGFSMAFAAAASQSKVLGTTEIFSPRILKIPRGGVRTLPAVPPENNNEEPQPTNKKQPPSSDEASKRAMLRFALPALGIYLTNPLMSNIDNAFVGRTAGTQALAAMSPGTTLSDLLLMMFSFLGRATTGVVSRAYKLKDGKGDTEAASKAASARKFQTKCFCFEYHIFLVTYFLHLGAY